MTLIVEEIPSTKPVHWTVVLGNNVTSLYPTVEENYTQSSDDCLHALYAASDWINLGYSEVEKWEWVVNNAPEWLTVEVIDESRT